MLKILLPVDGSENSDRAARHLIGMAGHCGAMDIRVANVQPPFLYIEVLMKPRQEVLDAWAHKAGKDAARSACALLDAAGIPYTLELVEGEIADPGSIRRTGAMRHDRHGHAGNGDGCQLGARFGGDQGDPPGAHPGDAGQISCRHRKS